MEVRQQTMICRRQETTNCICQPSLLANTLRKKDRQILVRVKMSRSPGCRVSVVFLHVRNTYSIPRIAELPRVALSINWILQSSTIRWTVIDTRLEEGSTNIILRKRSLSDKSQHWSGHLLHMRGRICQSIFRLNFKL